MEGQAGQKDVLNLNAALPRPVFYLFQNYPDAGFLTGSCFECGLMNLFRLILCLIALALYAIVKQFTASSPNPGRAGSSAIVQTPSSAVGVITEVPAADLPGQANAAASRVFSLEADSVGGKSLEPNRISN